VDDSEVSKAILEMRDLLRLLAEPAIAERDKKRREDLKRIVGASTAKAGVVFLLDGTRTQAVIRRETGFNQGHLSTLVKELTEAGLVSGDIKQPKLAISIPQNFFEKDL
jgi:hypothetical protein